MDLSGATILLTGGTGSFGNAFARRVTRDWPDSVVRVYSRDELKQSEMLSRFGDGQVRFLIGDVRDRSRMTRAAEGADIVIHAAAMKQVPACEYNPFEAVRTNVLGAQHVIDAAIDSGVQKVVALSAPFLHAPRNAANYRHNDNKEQSIIGVMNGSQPQSEAEKRFARLVRQVVPNLHAQNWANNADERMTRFWITLEQAVDLVLFALDNMVGGEVFIPKIPSMRVVDLADAMAPGLPREIVGIRPGEKLHELLLTVDESRHAVDADGVYVVLPEHPWWDDHPRWLDGKPLDDGFVYSSDRNEWWLTREELTAMLP